MTATPRKKLIEVSLPLAEINAAAAKEKSIRHGHPSTLHLWWARRPLAACRAVLFASLVDDPDSDPDFADKSPAERAIKRDELHRLIADMVRWENSNDPEILRRAREEILRCTGGNPPPVLDPFCGGGSIPLEAQRLGLEAHGSDLNPVAVLITKALVEIPPRFSGMKPVHPDARRQVRSWSGAEGLAADVRAYGAWMRAEAAAKIGDLYPKVRLPKEHGGGEATAIAWLWARTVTCPNPACGAAMPLVSNFMLSTKKGKETWVEPVVEPGAKRVRFEVQSGQPKNPEVLRFGTGMLGERGKKVQATFVCPACNSGVAKAAYVDSEAAQGRMGVMPIAQVAEGNRRRVYIPFTDEEFAPIAEQLNRWFDDPEFVASLPNQQSRGTFASNAQGRRYGFNTFKDYFSRRQLVALTTFSDLVGAARERALADARAAGLPDDATPLAAGGRGAQAYADAVATYLGITASKVAVFHNTLARWRAGEDKSAPAFGRQAIPMVWDFAEVNPWAGAGGDIQGVIDGNAKAIAAFPAREEGTVKQQDATNPKEFSQRVMVCTDPPYYDNIGYADLSDFFYVWLRKSLRTVFPDLFATLLTPKEAELIATPYRHDGDRVAADLHFENGLKGWFAKTREYSSLEVPVTMFYAFRQRDDSDNQVDGGDPLLSSTGWETMLEGLVQADFQITGTWPVRTEMGSRMIGQGTNALASSIVLACRPRPADAPSTSRRAFVEELRRELARELPLLLEADIPPVDLAQAAIGPGLAVFTKYREVLEADGEPMRVRTALALINDELARVLEEGDERLDAATRFCLAWFSQHGYAAGRYGDAEVLGMAKGIPVDALDRAGVVESRQSKVRLLRRDELDAEWDPRRDDRTPTWEALQHLVRRLEDAGIEGAGALLALVGDEQGEMSRQLAVRLYELCDRKRWAGEAYAYNQFAREFPDIQKSMGEERVRYETFVQEYPAIKESSRKYKAAWEQAPLV